MIRTLALLCLVAAPAFGLFGLFGKDTSFDKGFKVRFDTDLIFNYGKTAFMDQPDTKTSAEEEGWEIVEKPNGLKDFASLVLLCPKHKDCEDTIDRTLCLFFDDTGYTAGFQIAYNTKQFTDSIYDWETQGFTSWTIDNNGVTENYWTTQAYFASPEFYKTKPEARIAARDETKLLQDTVIYVSGINGELHPISTDPKVIANTALSNFTEQACMMLMGHHYYYRMTKDTECNDQLFPWFPLVYKGQLVGIGHVSYGKFTPKEGCMDYSEKPPKLGVKVIVPRGPECMYNLADSPGLVTQHTYFIKNPRKMNCIFD